VEACVGVAKDVQNRHFRSFSLAIEEIMWTISGDV
jgi:hypothetical protein